MPSRRFLIFLCIWRVVFGYFFPAKDLTPARGNLYNMIKITKIFSKHKVKKSFFPWIIHLGLGLLIMVICFFLTERTAVRLVNIPAQTQGVWEYSWHVMAIMPTSVDSYWKEMRQ